MSKTDTMPGYYLKDEERTAFGLGWEYCRRGLSINNNPFETDNKKWQEFRDGYREFTPPKIGGKP